MQLVGKAAPQLNVTTHDKKEMKIGGPSDKVQIVTFYASWCTYCKQAMPMLEAVARQYKDKGVQVIVINTDGRTGTGSRARTEEQTLEAYRQWNLSMPLVLDPEQKIGRQFSMAGTGIPAFFLLGKSGTVEAVHTGYKVLTDKTVVTELDLLLQGKTRADFPTPEVPAASQPALGS